jgi:GT2 family glycosyltransferase/glycosyltransferase involved in cell wall biosynthesis
LMYTGHLSVYRKSLVEAVGGFRTQYDFSQDYDLVLRVAEQSPKVFHLQECLYGWRMIAGSAAQGEKPLARLSNLGALQSAADRRQIPGHTIGLRHSNRIKRPRASATESVSIIIPSDNTHNIIATLASILISTSYPNFEIIVVANSGCIKECRRSYSGDKVHYITYDEVYNFSGKCNAGAKHASSQHLIFFNDDVRVTDPDWIDVVLEALLLPGVGIVGPKLLYENGAIQHGGMVTGVRSFIGTAFHTFPDATSSHFGLAQTVREVSLICGACLCIRRSNFQKIGGFDAVNTPIAHSDVDLCFRIREIGLTCVYTAHTQLTHIGHLSIGAAKQLNRSKKVREQDKSDIFLLTRWARYCAYDPYFPPGIRDILFIDSQEPFRLYVGDRKEVEECVSSTLIMSHDLSGSGAPKIAFDLSKVLIGKGHYVLVVSPEDGPFRQRLLSIGVDVVIDPLCISGTDKDFYALANRFDTVILNTVVTWRVLNQIAQSVSVCWYVHETELVGHLAHQHPELGQAASFAQVWAGSAKAADVLKAMGINCTIVEYGVAPFQLPAGDGTRSSRTIISVMATYEPRKGQDLALLAIQMLPENLLSECEFRFAGRVNDHQFFEALKTMDEDRSLVTHLGILTLEDYQRNLHEADVILCPSRDDTLPLVSLDALANGKILVCCPTIGTSTYIKNGKSGFVSRSPAPADIADALLEALISRPKWPEISSAAVEVFKFSFSQERFASRISDLLDAQENTKGRKVSCLVSDQVYLA